MHDDPFPATADAAVEGARRPHVPTGEAATRENDGASNGRDGRAIQGIELARLGSALLLILGIGLFLALPFVLSIGSIVFLPFVTAIVLTIILSPLADWLGRLGLPNVLASFLAMLVFIGVVVLAATAIVQPAVLMFDRVPQMLVSIRESFGQLKGQFDWLNDLNRQFTQIAGVQEGQQVIVATPSMLERVALATPTFILETLLTLLMAFFMIEARVRMRRRLLFERSEFGASLRAARALREVQDRVASYILTVGVINLGVGVIAALGAWALGLEAPIMWGGLAAILNFLPYLGPLVMTGIVALVGLGSADTILAGLIPAAAYLALHAVESNAVTPTILGARFTVNPVLILLAISYFTWIWGVLGAVLSMPILITLLALFEHLGHPNVIGFLFGEPLFLPRDDEGDAQHA